MAPSEVRKKLVKKAGKLAKPMSQLGCDPKEEELKTNDGEILKLSEFWGTNLEKEQQEWIFDLFNRNMYKISQWGYDAKNKQDELFSTTSRFIVVENNKEPVGFVHYRFVLDNNIPSVYCFELQVKEMYQQKGVGSLLLKILEKMCKNAGLTKVLATVFAFNAKSLGFFHKNGYLEDGTCPTEEQQLDYLILSKEIN